LSQVVLHIFDITKLYDQVPPGTMVVIFLKGCACILQAVVGKMRLEADGKRAPLFGLQDAGAPTARHMRLPTAKFFITLFIIISTIAPTFAIWMRTTPVPLDRLLKNISSYIAKKPQDARGYYVRGRLHSLAYSTGTRKLEMYETGAGKLPEFPGDESIFAKRTGKFQLTTSARQHLLASIRDYQRATELDPKHAMAWLGLGWVLEDGSTFAARVPAFPKEKKAALPQRQWQDKALAAYRQAYQLTAASDLKLEVLGPGAHAAISYEAGESLMRLLRNRELTAAEHAEIKRIETTLAEIEKKPRAITPIIFPLDEPAPLASLLAHDHRVHFDLAGDGKAGLWPWVKPGTGILVWAPKRTDRITSGLQMFGSVTWWIAWANGYQPLALLDNDGDGWLAGKELKGLAVWVDANANGVSEASEVHPPAHHNIVRVAVHSTATIANTPSNLHGLQLREGRFLPTYDWTPQEIKSVR
jgi:hypothetical protein